MLNLVRKSLLITAIVCFLAMVTGLTLMLHLSSIEHPEEHNCENCPICQQIVINKNPAILCFSIVIHAVNEITFTISYSKSFLPRIVKFHLPQLRAPPGIS